LSFAGDLVENEELDLVYPARQKMATLSSCFAQLTHKAQTIFQNSAKVEVGFLSCITPNFFGSRVWVQYFLAT